MPILDALSSPADLRGLDASQLEALADEIREFLVSSVCRTGGHLGPNLGVVELTLAVHRVFDSPHTPVVFDTGHQAYVHKLLTGRRDGFAGLRTSGGLSGYPNRAESVHDVVENSHASTALSYADGLSKAFTVSGEADRPVVAVIGDGALTGGLAWEALNNLGASGRRVVVVLNDNGCSYSPTVGGLPAHLARLRDQAGYDELVGRLGGTARLPDQEGRANTLFGALGFSYLGPVDGHDLAAVERALTMARDKHRPVIVHCLTVKGRGYVPALADQADHLHTVGVVDALTGRPGTEVAATWTDAFATALVELGGRCRDIVAVTAAMRGPTGLQQFANRYPGRCFDVGIAEQHAVTSAAGLAIGGAHPVVALYATFANRAFDQALLDVGLHELPVTFVLDRAGITGPDGASHHGMWDLAMFGIVPGIRVAAPRDAATLVDELDEAVAVSTGPTVLRFPKARLGKEVPATERVGGIDVLRSADQPDVLIVAVGVMAHAALSAAAELAGGGIECTVVDPRWVIPVNPRLIQLASKHQLVVCVEDGVRSGGVGALVAGALADAGVDVPAHCLGLPSEFIPHGDRAELLSRYGLDGAGVAAAVRRSFGRQSPDGRQLRLVAAATPSRALK
ncbi:MAG: 1-deoxy-D-xylulose-5-phosphate synthase [Nocardioidaceae bacterium]